MTTPVRLVAFHRFVRPLLFWYPEPHGDADPSVGFRKGFGPTRHTRALRRVDLHWRWNMLESGRFTSRVGELARAQLARLCKETSQKSRPNYIQVCTNKQAHQAGAHVLKSTSFWKWLKAQAFEKLLNQLRPFHNRCHMFSAPNATLSVDEVSRACPRMVPVGWPGKSSLAKTFPKILGP